MTASKPPNGSIGYTVLKPLLPSSCTAAEECVAKFGKHSVCREFWCECEHGAEYDAAFSKKCLLSRRGLGESCKENGDCRMSNAYCKGGMCHCMAGYVFSDDGTQCLPVATEKAPSCKEARQCVMLLNAAAGPTGPAVCVEGHCKCRYDHEHVNGTCVLKQARGKACTSDVQCEDLSGGACIQGVCGCKDEMVPVVAANKCLPVLRTVPAACEVDIQCSEGLGDLARCSAGQCACVDGAQLSEDTKKCSCSAGEEYSKSSNRCEKSLQSQQEAVKEEKPGKDAASSLLPSIGALLISWVVLLL